MRALLDCVDIMDELKLKTKHLQRAFVVSISKRSTGVASAGATSRELSVKTI